MIPFGNEHKNHFTLQEAKEFRVGGFIRKRLFETSDMHFNVYCIAPGQQNPLHRHPFSDEILYFVEGTGECVVGEEPYSVKDGDIVFGIRPQKFPSRHSQYAFFGKHGVHSGTVSLALRTCSVDD